MTTQALQAVASPAVLRWGVGPRAFELRCTDQEVLRRAAAVFQPWGASPDVEGCCASWTVTRSPEGILVARDQAPPDEPPQLVRRGPHRAVTVVEYKAVTSLTGETPDVLTFHAALVSVHGRGVMIVGPSEAGKSTLATALWLHRHRLLGDDVAVVEAASGIARSGPRRVSLRTPSRPLLGETLWERLIKAPASEETVEGYLFHPHEVDGKPRQTVVKLAACVFLARRTAGPSTAGRLPEAEASLALVPYANLIHRRDLGTVLEHVSPLASAVAMYDLPRAPLPEMIAAIEALVENAG